jgi:DNA-binding GntR family transcriptional regulator
MGPEAQARREVDARNGRHELTEAVYQRLYADVMFGRLASGQRVTERALAAELGLSVAPVRAALARLDHDGFVTTLPRKGYRITPLTLKSVDDLFTLWRIIAPELVRRGIATPDIWNGFARTSPRG